MDVKTVELLVDRSEKTVMNFFQKLHDSLKTDIADVIKENVELRRSLEFTQDKLDEATEVIKRHEAKFRQLNENSDLAERVRSLEDYSRSSNIIIDGIPETNDESNERLQVDISKILSEKMKVTPKISTCHRIGNKTPSRNRPIIVKLSSQDDRNKCLRNAPKLKGTNIFINEDVSKATQEIRRTKMPELMEKRKAGMIAYFSGTRIVTRSRQVQPSTQREQRAADFPSSTNKDFAGSSNISGGGDETKKPTRDKEAQQQQGTKKYISKLRQRQDK